MMGLNISKTSGVALLLALAAAMITAPQFTGFYLFITGSNSQLAVWSTGDVQGGSTTPFINDDVTFFANFSTTSSGSPIVGGSTYCEIMFNTTGSWTTPVTMTYNGSSGFYEYTRNFPYIGNHSWNVRCDGTSLGYDDLNGTDNVTVYRYEWWNDTWKYRLKIDVLAGDYNVTNWPIERDINFTDVLRQQSVFGTLDLNSTRIIEYNSTGGVMHELPSQFDTDESFSSGTSDSGNLVFLMNGTTENNTQRTFYLYFDTQENGNKSDAGYSSGLNYVLNGDEINVNNTKMNFYIDTNRSENTSGIFVVYIPGATPPYLFFNINDNERTVEYLQYSNGTYNFSFDLRNNLTIVTGPVRTTVIQKGNEIIWGDIGHPTGEGNITKKYYFYNKAGPQSTGTFIKMEQIYTNAAGYSIQRNSTEAGAPAFNVKETWESLGGSVSSIDQGNTSDPYSWFYALSNFGHIVGIINLEESIADFFATNDSVGSRIGIQLDSTSIGSGESLAQKSLVYFGKGSGQTDEFLAIKNAIKSPETVTEHGMEQRTLYTITSTDYSVYNRNETIWVTVNVSYDPYGLFDTLNVTLSNGTAGSSDDIDLQVYDDGTHGDATANDNVFTNYYHIDTGETTGLWSVDSFFYDSDSVLINHSYRNITITSEFFVNTTIENPTGTVGRLVNATVNVMNYRQDVWQPNSTINCSVFQGGSKLFDVNPANIGDYNNGTYAVNFSAPVLFGLFTLNCSATKYGNLGYDTEDFTAEELETNMSITVSPKTYTALNVTSFDNESFVISVNATNTANATAFNTTVALELPINMTSNASKYDCGDLLISKSCFVSFNVTILNSTVAANFTLNTSVTWNNTDQTPAYNETSMNVTIKETYILDVQEDYIVSTVAPGVKKNIGNATIRSYGSGPLTNVTFDIIGFPSEFNFTFDPINYSSIGAGVTEIDEISLTVGTVYSTGFYNGTLNVTSANGGYKELEINITVSGTNVTLDIYPHNFTAPDITYYAGDSFNLSFNSTNTGNNTAYNTNVTLTFSDGLIYTSNTTPYQCGDVESGSNCTGTFDIIISNGTPSGNYTINVSTEWSNPEIGIDYNLTTINVTVLSNVNLTVPEDNVTGTITHGTTGALGSFTLNSTGNDPVTGINFTIGDDFGKFEDFTFTITPNITVTQGGVMPGGQVVAVDIDVGIPLSYPNGTYLGYINITTANAGYINLTLNITVPESRTWLIQDPADLSCEHPETPENSTACNITVNNTGNVNISFSVFPAADGSNENNQTWPEYTSFVVENQTTFILTMYYNVTDDELLFYNANYNLTAKYGQPAYQNFSILLTPFVKPLVYLSISPDKMPQLGSTEIYVTVVDQGGVAGINFTTVSVTRPDNTTDSIRMRRVGSGTDPYIYQEFYPTDPINGTWGDTLMRGNYTVIVYSEDNLQLNDTNASSFYAYTVLYVNLTTTRANGEYYQGEIGTLVYTVEDAAGNDLQDVNVSLSIIDPNNHSISVEDGDFITNAQGEPASYPYFRLFSDSPTGTYNLSAYSEYNDTPIAKAVQNYTEFNFTVAALKPGLITLDLEAPFETSIDDGLEVYAIVTDGTNNVDPDTITVTLYDSLGNTIMVSQPMIQMSTGRYRMNYTTSASSNQGNWRWVVSITKDSNSITKDVYSRLVGGPFDVRDISILDSGIPDLSISVVIENTGDDDQDAFVQWNLTRTDTGESLDEGFDTVMVPANSEITRTVTPNNITYLGDVRITFIVTYSGTEKAGAYDDFTTTEEAPPGPSPPPSTGGTGGQGGQPSGTGGAGGPIPVPGIEITDYPDEIATETGWAQYPSVTVNNTGNSVLHNVMIELTGIPDTWYTVTPTLIPLLNPGKSTTFVINVLVPSGTEARQYYGTINATSDETSDEKLTSVIVFGSREELVRYQLEKLKQAFKEFGEDVNATAERGEKDLTRVYEIMEEIQHQIDLTDGYLNAKLFAEALDSVTTGWRLLDRARELLRDAPALKPTTIIEIPDWLITVILILIIAALGLVILINRYKKRLNMVFKFRERAPETEAAKDLIGIGPAAEREEEEAAVSARRAEQRTKIEKVLGLLEREYKEGIISEKAYNELRKRNLDKLKELGGTAK